MRGDYLPDFEELVAYSNRNIPHGDAILMLPGEDLFYFTTGRTPQFPVLLLDNTVNPYSAAQIVELARQRNVDWLIVKRTLQLQEEPLSFRPQLLELLSHDFDSVESLNNYDIYRRKQNGPTPTACAYANSAPCSCQPNTNGRGICPGLSAFRILLHPPQPNLLHQMVRALLHHHLRPLPRRQPRCSPDSPG